MAEVEMGENVIMWHLLDWSYRNKAKEISLELPVTPRDLSFLHQTV